MRLFPKIKRVSMNNGYQQSTIVFKTPHCFLLTLSFPVMNKTEFLLTILIQSHIDK